MESVIEQYLIIFAGSMLKFIVGPVTGATTGLSVFETALFTTAGMMTTVLVLTYLGKDLRRRLFDKLGGRRKLFTPRNRKIVRIWGKYGAFGVAFLTPLLFSPPIGTIILVSFGTKKAKILISMLVSGLFWGFFYSLLFILGGEQVMIFLRNIGLLKY